MPRKPITCLELNFTNLPPSTPYFVVTIHRGNWNKEDSTCCHYWRVKRTSLLRVNRAQRLLIRCVTPDQIGPSAPPAPDSNTELAQLVTLDPEDTTPGVPMCGVADCLDGAAPGYIYCARHLPVWTGEQIIQREG